MLTIGALQVVITTDLDRLTGGMRTAAAEVDSSSQRMSRSVGGAALAVSGLENRLRSFDGSNSFNALAISALRAENSVNRLRSVMLLVPAALGGVGLATSARALMDYADAATQVRNRLSVVTSSVQERLSAEREVYEISQRTRSQYQATAALYARTSMAGQSLGRSQSEMLRFTEAVQMTSAISGATPQESSASAIQLAQGLASGRLQGDELKSILENNVALSKVLAEELAGGSVGRLREMGSEGLLNATNVLDAVLRRSGEIRRDFDKMSPTVAQGFTVIDNAITRYVGQMDQAVGASRALYELMQGIASNLPAITTALAIGAGAIAGRLIGGVAGRAGSSVAGQVSGVIQERRGAVLAAQASIEQASAAVAEARRNASVALGSRDELAAKPTFSQASREAMDAYSREQARAARIESDRVKTVGELASLQERRAAAEARLGKVDTDYSRGALRPLYRASFENSQALAELDRANRLAAAAPLQREAFAKMSSSTFAPEAHASYMAAFRKVEEDAAQGVTQARERAFSAQQRLLAEQEKVDATALSQKQRHLAAIAQIDGQIAQKQGAIQALSTSARFQQGRVETAREGVSSSAQQNVAQANTVLAQANAAVSRTLTEAAGATDRFASAQARASGVSIAFASATRLVGGAITSLYSFLGGPWGLIFTGLGVGLAALGMAHANAAARAKEQEEVLARLPEAIRKVEAARQLAAQGGGQQREAEISGAADLQRSETTRRERFAAAFADIEQQMSMRQVFSLLKSAGVNLPEIPASGRGSASTPEGLATIANALDDVVGKATLSAEQLERVRDSLAGAGMSATALDPIIKKFNDLIAQSRQLDSLRSGQQGLAAENAIARSLEGEPFALGQVEARRRSVQQMAEAIQQAKATAEAAAPAIKTISEETTRPLTEGAAGFDLAQRMGISERAKTAIQEYAAAMTQLRVAAGGINDDSLRSLITGFVSGSVTLADFKAKLEELKRAHPDMAGIARGLSETADSADRGRRSIDTLQAAINALTGKTVDIIVRTTTALGRPEEATEADGLARRPLSGAQEGNLGRVLADQRVREAQRRSRLSKEQAGIEDLANQLGVAPSDPRLREIYQNNLPERRANRSQERAEARVMRELTDEAKVASAGLSQLDREVVRYARSAKLAGSDTDAFLQALASGNLDRVPEKVRRIREQLQIIQESRLRQKYETPYETLQRELRDLQAIRDPAERARLENRARDKSGLDAVPEIQGAMFDFLKSAVDDFNNVGQAAQNLAKRVRNALLDEMLKPAEQAMRDLIRMILNWLREAATSSLGGGGLGLGGIGSAFAGAFGGGANSGPLQLSGGLNPFSMYDIGGYTGAGGVNDPAGIVHKGEVVWSQRDVARAGGVGVVEAMRLGLRGYASGGPVAAAYAAWEPRLPRASTGAIESARYNGGAPRITINNHVGGEVRESHDEQGNVRIDIVKAVEGALADRLARGRGDIGSAIGTRFGIGQIGGRG